ncbi:MAG: NF038122 family metalloprotease [Limnospira sp.]
MIKLKPKLKLKKIPLHLLCVVSGIALASPGQAATFNFVHDFGTSQEIADAFDRAGDIWSSILYDDVEINIFVKYDQMASDTVLGGARPEMVEVSYNQYLNRIFRDITSEDDLRAFKTLQFDEDDTGIAAILDRFGLADISQLTLSQVLRLNREAIALSTETFGMLRDRTDGSGIVLDDNGNANNRTIWLTRANAKALGLMPGYDNTVAFDSEIAMNSNVLSNSDIWDFSRVYNNNVAIANGKLDFMSVALHEIGHSLGFVSGIDTANLLYMLADSGEGAPVQETDLTYVSTLDLFRHSETSRDANVFDWTGGTGKYFSLDGGATNLGNFAGGVRASGDGYQTSHWEKQDNPLGIMHPTLQKGQILDISAIDRQLLDVTGWDLELSNLSRGNSPNRTMQGKQGTDTLMSWMSGWWNRWSVGNWRWWMQTDDGTPNTQYFSSLDPDSTSPNPAESGSGEMVSVPEPTSVMGLLGLGALGFGTLRKRHGKGS